MVTKAIYSLRTNRTLTQTSTLFDPRRELRRLLLSLATRELLKVLLRTKSIFRINPKIPQMERMKGGKSQTESVFLT